MKYFLQKILKIKVNEFSKLGNLNKYSFDELKTEFKLINPEVDIKIIEHDIEAFSAKFETKEYRISILYSEEGKYISTLNEIWF